MQKFPYLVFGGILIALDQLSKWAVTEKLFAPPENSLGFFEWLTSAPPRLPFASIEILPFFNIVMVWNQGVSFGLFNQGTAYAPYILSALAIVISTIFAIWLWRTRSPLQALSIILVIAGALGNVVDRLRFGAVIDFLDVHAYGYHWPAFNIADSCISIGVFLLIVQSLFFDSGKESAT